VQPRDGEPGGGVGGASASGGWRGARVLLGILVVCYCVYAGVFIYRTSFVISGRRCFCLFDDAMVSMRYAANLAHGQGLVWNPGGERVEGFTNPLWVVFMSLFHLLPISDYMTSLAIQISGALFALMAALYARGVARALSGGSELAGLSAAVLTAFYLPLVSWSIQGTEVSVLALLVAAAAYLMVRSLGRGEFSVAAYGLLGVAVLVRLDAAVLLVTVMVFGMVADGQHRWRHAKWGAVALAVGAGSQTLFRMVYYGDVLPNTYYLKMTGYPTALRALRGLICFAGFALLAPWWLLGLGLSGVVWHRDRRRLLLGALFCAQCAYSVYAGGDAWEWWGGANRYVAIVMPLLLALVAVVVAEVVGWAEKESGESPKALRYAMRGGGVAVVLGCLVASNSFSPSSLREWVLVEPPLHQKDNALNVRTAELLRAVTTEKALVAVSWAGAIPYFSHRRSFDLLGKCDRRIAHEQVHVPEGWTGVSLFIPGHLKWDFEYSMVKVGPDITLRDVSRGPKEIGFFMKHYRSFYLGEHEVYVKIGSPNVRWEELYRVDAAERERRWGPKRPAVGG